MSAPLAEVTDYPSLILALRARASSRGIAIGGESAARVSGLSDRYVSRVLTLTNIAAAICNQGEKFKGARIGMQSLGPLLGLLGVKLLMVEDQWAIKKFGQMTDKSKSKMLAAPSIQIIRNQIAKENCRKGGHVRAAKLTNEERSRIAKRAARARWTKARAASGGCPDAPDA